MAQEKDNCGKRHMNILTVVRDSNHPIGHMNTIMSREKQILLNGIPLSGVTDWWVPRPNEGQHAPKQQDQICRLSFEMFGELEYVEMPGGILIPVCHHCMEPESPSHKCPCMRTELENKMRLMRVTYAR